MVVFFYINTACIAACTVACIGGCLFALQLVVIDVYNHRFHKIFGPNDPISNILDHDDIFV